MSRVASVIVSGADGVEVRMRAPLGERLLDVFDEVQTPVPFGCRDATCGTCLVEIVSGGACLAPPAPAEQEVLETVAATPPGQRRLACQIRVVRAGLPLRLRVPGA